MKPYYEKDGITIYHGDCWDIVPHLYGFDAVITDPPYGIGFKSNGQWFVDSESIAGDTNTDLAEWCRDRACRMGSACCMFFSPFKPLSGWRSVLVWVKGEHVGIGGDRETCWKRDFELIGVEGNKDLEGKRDSAVLRFRALLPPPSGHFAEKPVSLMAYLVQKLNAFTVLDPFMGSGSTLVAAKQLGRGAVGIEIEEKYCEIAAKRLSQGVMAF